MLFRSQLPKIKNIHPKLTDTSSPNSSKNTSAHTAPPSVTHPSIPSQEGNSNTINHSLPIRNKHSEPPLSRGAGVCDARAQLPKTKHPPEAKKRHIADAGARESLRQLPGKPYQLSTIFTQCHLPDAVGTFPLRSKPERRPHRLRSHSKTGRNLARISSSYYYPVHFLIIIYYICLLSWLLSFI